MSEEAENIVPGQESVTENLSPEEKLAELEKAYAGLQQQYEELKSRNILEKISIETGCTDPEYLRFCAARKNIDLNDPEALREFAGQLAAVSPGCFKARITPGSSAGTALQPASAAGSAAEDIHGDRINRIALSIDHAPEAV
ncbi:MAG: hypothetical protein IKD23_07400 [Lentisphaeria bacterium]|nr:hypothetical protein [Lentisphaerota bacterium]MBR2626202.1 hypothetical protein [Lentisphaeria bacterium]